jgi:hypothetical protein
MRVGRMPEDHVAQMAAPRTPPSTAMKLFVTLATALPAADTVLFFYYSDALGFTPQDFGVMDGLSATMALAGTYLGRSTGLPVRYTLSTIFYYACVFAVLNRSFLGWDRFFVLVSLVPVNFYASALSTQYAVDSGTELPWLSAMSNVARGAGLGASTALTLAFDVNHNAYGNLVPMVFACGTLSAALVMCAVCVPEPPRNTHGSSFADAGDGP